MVKFFLKRYMMVVSGESDSQHINGAPRRPHIVYYAYCTVCVCVVVPVLRVPASTTRPLTCKKPESVIPDSYEWWNLTSLCKECVYTLTTSFCLAHLDWFYSTVRLKTKSCHDTNFVTIGDKDGCHNDNLWCDKSSIKTKLSFQCIANTYRSFSGKLWYLQHKCAGDTIV